MRHLLAGLLILVALLAGGAARAQATAGRQVRVQPLFGAAPLVLDAPQPYLTARQEPVTIGAFRFYLTDLELVYADGTRYADPQRAHLLDADEPATLTLALPGAPAGSVQTLRFWIGPDSAASTTGAQGGDLDPARGMYWAWHSGYICAKLEGHSPRSPDPKREFAFHIGGYRAPHNARRAVTVVAGGSADPTLVLGADAAAWLADVQLADTYNVVQPGAAAMRVADAYARMFRLLTP